MYNNPLYLNRTSLELAHLPVEGDIVFRQGELLQGVVKSVNPDGIVLLSLKGRVIEAAAQVPVAVGQHLLLAVDQIDARGVRLKVMTPAEAQHSQDQFIADRLMEMGIPPKPGHVNMAKHLLSYDLILNRPNMEALIKSTALLGAATQENINLAAFQTACGFPRDSVLLQALAQYASPGSDLNMLIKDVLRALSDWNNAKGPGQQPGSTPSPAPAVNTAMLTPDAAAAADSLRVGSAIEASPAPAVIQPAVQSLLPEEALKRLLALVKQELASLSLNLGEASPDVATRLEKILRSQPDVLRGLLLLEETLKHNQSLASDRAGITVMNKLESLSREVLGQHLINLTASTTDEAPQYYFSLPLQWGLDTQPCEVRISGDAARSGLREQEQITVAVALETPRLGAVLFHVTWHRSQQIEIRGVIDSQLGLKRLRPYMQELEQALQELGYTVKDYGLKVIPALESDSLKIAPQPPVKAGRGGWLKVDIQI